MAVAGVSLDERHVVRGFELPSAKKEIQVRLRAEHDFQATLPQKPLSQHFESRDLTGQGEAALPNGTALCFAGPSGGSLPECAAPWVGHVEEFS